MEIKYEHLKTDILDEIEAIELVLEDLSSLTNNIDTLWIDIKSAIKEFCGKI